MSATPQQASPTRTTASVPRATYRVQLHAGYRFPDATALVPYLAGLGISHLYISPPLRARPGSMHGYDVIDHGMLNPELGTRDEFDAMVAELNRHGMKLLVDIVPNHMGVLSGDNAWWLDVLENGAASEHAGFFDIDWHAADPALTGRVLLPILGDQYGVVLERGEIQLAFERSIGAFTLGYYEHKLPVDPGCYGRLLRSALEGSGIDGAHAELKSLADAFDGLPPHGSTDPDDSARRQREKTTLKEQLARLAGEHPGVADAIDAVVGKLNGTPDARDSFDALDALTDAQPYRLAHWRVAGDEINYRRFFDINELAALRMEDRRVFDATHGLIFDLVASGAIDGLRIDHPDGLADPARYFRELQERYAERTGRAAPVTDSATSAPETPLFVTVEKIVAPHEQLPRDWAVHGTTGYRFANVINGLLIDGGAKARLDRAWRAFARDEAEDFDTLAWRCKHVVMDSTLAGELTVLSTALLRLAREDRRTRDFTLNLLREALSEVVASFPVYRTYVVDQPSAQDRKYIDWAIGRARRRSVAADASVFDFLRQVLLGKPMPGAPAGLADRYRSFARRLQQYTAPVAAKGIEDTALYRHQRLISVNDVGGEPDAFGMSVAAFHHASRDRAVHWPHEMLATSTHDAKRSEDVRARIDVISELPAAWRLTVRRWSRMNRSHKRTVDGATAPSRNDEYLLYQMLVGTLPTGPLGDDDLAAYRKRLDQAMLKSVRESKAITSWVNPNPEYEAALSAFIEALLTRRENSLFLDDLQSSAAIFAWYGALSGLTLAAVKGLSPGIPDYYQGHEAIELSMVDPDNRRPVDYDRRRQMLDASRTIAAQPDRGSGLRELLQGVVDGRAKFHVTWCALQLHRDYEDCLRAADYLPLEVTGERANHLVAFARSDGKQCIVVVATRLYASLHLEVGSLPIGEVWQDEEIVWPADVELPGHALRDAITGSTHDAAPRRWPVSLILRDLPVAMLGSIDTQAGSA